MRRTLVVGAAALVAAFVASVAHADQALTDPLGDGQTAADVTGVAVASDNHGNISFHITWAGGQLLPKGDVLRLAIDTDRNPLTGGEEGEEVAIELDGDPSYAAFGSWFDGRWDGAQIDYDWIARSARVRFRPGEIDVSINNADLNHSIAFDFWVYSDRMDGDDVVGEDLVPDGSAVYTHALAAPVRAQKATVRLTTGRAQATPASPRAGRRFALAVRVGGADARSLRKATVRCQVHAGTRLVRAAGSFAGGMAHCRLTVPRGTAGKTLRGAVSVAAGGTTSARTFAFAIRR